MLPCQVLVGNRQHPRAHGLMQQLEDDWARKHGVYFHDRADPIPSRKSREARHVFTPKTCCLVGMCVCDFPGKAALLLWRKIGKCFRQTFSDKSRAKAKLDAGLVVLRFDIPESTEHPQHRFWFHLGYINRQTYHFTLLRLAERARANNGIQPLCFPDWNDDDEAQSFSSHFMLAIKAFAMHFVLQQPLTCAICYLLESRTKFLQQSDMQPHHVEVLVPSDATCPDLNWQGWDLEKPRPKHRKRGPRPKRDEDQEGGQASKHRKKNTGDSRSNPSKSKPPLADRDHSPCSSGYTPSIAPANDAQSGPNNAGSGDSDSHEADPLDMLSDDPSESEIDLATVSEFEKDDCDDLQEINDLLELAEMDIEHFHHQEDEPGVSLEPMGAAGPTSSEVAPPTDNTDLLPGPVNLLDRFNEAGVRTSNDLQEAAALEPASSSSIRPDPVAAAPDRSDHDGDKSSVCTDDLSISTLSVHRDSDKGSSSSSSGSSSDEAGEQPRASKKPRKPAEDRLPKIVDDRFDIDGIGSIRYNYRSESMVAFCLYHSGHCRRTRTTKASELRGKAGQGRPIGTLMAWLEQGSQFETAQAHSANCRPKYDDRKRARERFCALTGGKDWAASYERPLREGEGQEPTSIS